MSQGTWGCARHAQLGRTCCQDSEILLTEGDKVRIAAHVGRDDFWHESDPSGGWAEHDEDDPAWSLGFHEDGRRPVLRHADDARCTFLGDQGCLLPLQVRPLVCRLFPLEYREDGFVGVSRRCPDEVVPPGRTIVETLDLDRTTADRWRVLLYLELRAWPRREAG